MYTLIMIVMMAAGSSSTGGPVVVDNFTSKEKCEAFAANYAKALPKVFAHKGSFDSKNSIEHFVCLKKQ